MRRGVISNSYLLQRLLRSAGLGLGALLVTFGTWAIVAPASRGQSDQVAVLGSERAAAAARFRPVSAADARTSVTLVIDGIAVATDSRPAETVGGLLRSAGVDFGPGDRLTPAAAEGLVAGLRIVLERGFPVTVVDGGTPIALRAQSGTVGDFLARQGIALGPNDRLEVAADGPMMAGATVGIERVTFATASETIAVAAPVQTVGAPEQIVGWSQVDVAGKDGEAKVTYSVRYANGVETDRTIVSTEQTIAPVASVVRVGTRPKPAPAAPSEIQAIIRAAAAKYGVDADTLLRVAYCESGFNPNAYNSILGASGLFQIIPGTWAANSVRAGYGGANVFDPVANANVAAWMFSRGQSGQWVCK